MKLYLFEDVKCVSCNYHEGGGLVVIAKNKKELKEIINKEPYTKINEDEMKEVRVFKLDETKNYKPEVFVFPDAGCC